MITLDQSWRELGRSPIPGPEPFGSNPSDDPGFEAIEAEIDKLQTDPGAVDWGAVIESAVEVLQGRAKDWRVACRLAAALYQVFGVEGLAVGLAVLRDLIDESRWEKIFPPVRRAKLRGAFLDWFTERLNGALEKTEQEPGADDAEPLADAVASLAQIDGRLSAALGDHAPILSRLIGNLDQGYAMAKERAAERTPPPPEQAPAPAATDRSARPPQPQGESAAAEAAGVSAPAQPAAPPPAAPPRAPAAPMPSVTLSGDLLKTLRDVKNALLAVASGLRQASLSDPRGYLMLRTAIWLDLERLPPNQEGVTAIPEPSLDRRRRFEQLQQQGDWANLINEVEKTLAAGGIFWLAGHRLVANALESLGPAHLDARRAVVQSLAFLLRRFPGLERLKFQQGSGFADDLTLVWIGSEVMPAGSTASSAGDAGEQSAPWQATAAEAQALAVKGKVQEGLALFGEGIRHAGSLRERFCWELAQARACADAGYHQVAAMQTRHLADLVDSYRLDDWEPGLVVELARLYAGVHQPPKGGADEDAAQRTVYTRMLTRLARYDASAAFDLDATPSRA